MRKLYGIGLLILGFIFFVNGIIKTSNEARDQLANGHENEVVGHITGAMFGNLLVLGVFTYFGIKLLRKPKQKTIEIEEEEEEDDEDET